MTDFTSPTEQLFLGAALAFFFKFIWDRWYSKNSRVTPDGCKANQEECRAKMLTEFYSFKLEINNSQREQLKKMDDGDHVFRNINSRLDRVNLLLESMIVIQLELCRGNQSLDCENLTKLLVKQGIEVDNFLAQNRKDGDK